MKQLAIFDMDGTIFESYLDWERIRTELNITEGSSILKDIYKNNSVDHVKLNILETYERENTLKTIPIPGALEFILYLKNMNIKLALITNNNRENTDYLLNKYGLTFDTVITREMKLWKPGPDALIYVMNLFGCIPEETISIGDSIYDIKASIGAKISASRIFIIKSKSVSKFSKLSNNTQLSQLNIDGITYFENYPELIEIIGKIYSASIDKMLKN